MTLFHQGDVLGLNGHSNRLKAVEKVGLIGVRLARGSIDGP